MERSQSILRRLAADFGPWAFLVAAGCAAGPRPRPWVVHPVVELAPSDLDCPSEQILYEKFDDSTIGVSGCGKRATYERTCYTVFEYGTHGPYHTECKWQKH